MPRKPTGRPTGRPKGGPGTLGEVTRFTVRLPTALYQKLQTFADGHAYTRGDPELSGCVRSLLELALTCRHKQQTRSDSLQQTVSDQVPSSDEIQQTRSDSLQQTENTPPVVLDTADVDDMPVAPVGMSLQSAQRTLDAKTARVWQFLPSAQCACGHTSHGAWNRVRRTDPRKCWLCEEAAKAQKKVAKAHRPAPNMQEV